MKLNYRIRYSLLTGLAFSLAISAVIGVPALLAAVAVGAISIGWIATVPVFLFLVISIVSYIEY